MGHEVDVLPLGQLHGLGEAPPPLPQEQAVGVDDAAGGRDDGEGEEQGPVLEKVLETVVEELADRGVLLPQASLWGSASRREQMDKTTARGAWVFRASRSR